MEAFLDSSSSDDAIGTYQDDSFELRDEFRSSFVSNIDVPPKLMDTNLIVNYIPAELSAKMFFVSD